MDSIKTTDFKEFLGTVNFYLLETDLKYIWNGNIQDKVFIVICFKEATHMKN